MNEKISQKISLRNAEIFKINFVTKNNNNISKLVKFKENANTCIWKYFKLKFYEPLFAYFYGLNYFENLVQNFCFK